MSFDPRDRLGAGSKRLRRLVDERARNGGAAPCVQQQRERHSAQQGEFHRLIDTPLPAARRLAERTMMAQPATMENGGGIGFFDGRRTTCPVWPTTSSRSPAERRTPSNRQIPRPEKLSPPRSSAKALGNSCGDAGRAGRRLTLSRIKDGEFWFLMAAARPEAAADHDLLRREQTTARRGTLRS